MENPSVECYTPRAAYQLDREEESECESSYVCAKVLCVNGWGSRLHIYNNIDILLRMTSEHQEHLDKENTSSLVQNVKEMTQVQAQAHAYAY